ncbi:MAG TPA: hypothetical protein VFE32_16930 [Puia sp.]|jgi:hypothetical protein|nr:hypothetical protein [Puia sp.]
MKLTFFLIALGLILIRLSFPHLELWHNGRGQGTMITRSGDNYIQGIWWSGKVRFSDDERSIAEISPGGYLKFKENDTTLKAESDLQGEISYTLYNGHEELPLNDSGRRFIAAQVRKMIRFGFLADDRAKRIYKKGGVPALLAELSQIKMEGARQPYLDLLLNADTLTTTQRIELLQLIDNSDDLGEKQRYLGLFTPAQLRDSAIAGQWLITVGHIANDDMERELLVRYLTRDTDSIAGPAPARLDTILAITTRFEDPNERKDVYEKVIALRGLTGAGWIRLMRGIASLEPDDWKSELLTKIATVMPSDDSTRAEYRAAAKSIKDDWNYGKAMRALEN